MCTADRLLLLAFFFFLSYDLLSRYNRIIVKIKIYRHINPVISTGKIPGILLNVPIVKFTMNSNRSVCNSIGKRHMSNLKTLGRRLPASTIAKH